METNPEVFKKYERFGREVLQPKARQLWEVGHFNQSAWDLLAAEGFWLDMLADKNDFETWTKACSALEGIASSSCDSGFALSMVSQFGLYWGLLNHGTPEQIQAYLTLLRKGELCAIAIAESHTGTNITKLKTAARASGDGYSLLGEKFNISHAQTAKNVLVVGRISELGKRDITTFLLPTNQNGLSSEASPEKVGNRTLPTGHFHFEEVQISRDAILGNPGDGLNVIGSISQVQRAMYGLVGAVYLMPLLSEVNTFIRSREIAAESELVQSKIQTCEKRMDHMKRLSLEALDAVFNFKPEASKLASQAKLEVSLGMQQTASDLISLLGSRGHYHGIANQLKLDAQGWLWIGGTEEAHRLNLMKD